MAKKSTLQTPKQILQEFLNVLALEEKAARVYHQLAKDCEDPEISAQLEKISQDEYHHVAIAKKLVALAEKKSP